MHRTFYKSISTVFFCLFFITGNIFSQAYITTWKSDNTGSSANNQITIPASGTYDIAWVEAGVPANNGTVIGASGFYTLTFPSAGTYEISITGGITSMGFNSSGDKQKIISIEQWGSTTWAFMFNAYFGCSNLIYNATDAPDLSGVVALGLQATFYGCSSFDGDLSGWNTTGITDMSSTFYNCTSFNGDVSTWNTSSVTNMFQTFYNCTSFNQDLSGWVTTNVISFFSMFHNCNVFNGNLSTWNTGNVTTMRGMFYRNYVFNSNISGWNTAKVESMQNLFLSCHDFNQNIGGWNTGKVTTFRSMFNGCYVFNQDIGGWNTASAISFESMFDGCDVFNQDLNGWNTNNVTNMLEMFTFSKLFNQNLNSWNTSKVTDMSDMFFGADAFNGNISSWNTGLVLDMSGMFNDADIFNSDISGWNTAKVTTMQSMFSNAVNFNQDISGWNTGKVTDMSNMFLQATDFSQNLGLWDISLVTTMSFMLQFSGMTQTRYDNTLSGWASTASSKAGSGVGSTMSVQPNVSLGAFGMVYCFSEVGRNQLITNEGWIITGDSKNCPLPLEWLKFTAEVIENKVALNWATGAEINTDHFTIERSMDGEYWQELSNIEAAGNSSSPIDYLYTDNNPELGVSYYRIAQADLDGSYSYSEMKIVSIDKPTSTNASITVYPNPCQEQLTLSAGDNEIEHYRIFNHIGQEYFMEPKKNNKALSFDVKDMRPGIYYLEVNGEVMSFMKIN